MDKNSYPPNLRRLIINFLIEMVIYGVLLVAYFLTVLQILGEWLYELFNTNLATYAAIGLAIMLIQGVVLEWITSFIVRLMGLERTE